ncbi:MAG: hypothetical protein H0T73_19920 [Ardenticatenales bacterium]|nr:hypothetical protein [Ardenticatenales bacterium]
MNVTQWEALMTRWHEKLTSGWRGHPGATEEQIQQAAAQSRWFLNEEKVS